MPQSSPLSAPAKTNRSFYSGKKKRHTVKTEIRITPKGEIAHVSRSVPGSCHDFALYKKEPSVHKKKPIEFSTGFFATVIL
jgi:hypothetical protein